MAKFTFTAHLEWYEVPPDAGPVNRHVSNIWPFSEWREQYTKMVPTLLPSLCSKHKHLQLTPKLVGKDPSIVWSERFYKMFFCAHVFLSVVLSNPVNHRSHVCLSVDLMFSSRWSRITSLMYSYHARISVISAILPSRTFTLQGEMFESKSGFCMKYYNTWTLHAESGISVWTWRPLHRPLRWFRLVESSARWLTGLSADDKRGRWIWWIW